MLQDVTTVEEGMDAGIVVEALEAQAETEERQRQLGFLNYAGDIMDLIHSLVGSEPGPWNAGKAEFESLMAGVDRYMRSCRCELTRFQAAYAMAIFLRAQFADRRVQKPVKVKTFKHQLLSLGPAFGKTRILQGAIFALGLQNPKLAQLDVVVVYINETLKSQDDALYAEVQSLLRTLACTVKIHRFASYREAQDSGELENASIVFIDEIDYKVVEQVKVDLVDFYNMP